jgi:type III secretion protein C
MNDANHSGRRTRHQAKLRERASTMALGGIAKLLSVATLAGVVSIGCQQRACALEPKWPSGPYKYVVVEQDLKDALVEFGRNTNLPVKVSDEVSGKLRGEFPAANAAQFLERLCESYGLVWYFDGSLLYINATAELRTEVIDLGPLKASDVAEKLTRLGIADWRFPIRVSPGAGVASVSGPPPYLALLRQTLGVLAKQGEDTRVRVFRGTTS